ncbi:glycosyltransferase family 39 protein [Candidatus Woesebacteria bacterium]|nr:glycosyltransferase family 39 protein [Candidatus Woesebacteria bacterium]
MASFTDLIVKLKSRLRVAHVLQLLALLITYSLTRLTNILALPVFSDEGIYINWARIAAGDPAWRFISLVDGKQPLQTWGTIPFIKLFPDNLLLAGRLFSVTTGFAALIGIIALCWYLWGRRAGLLAGLLYVVCPYFLFYDRMALVDSGVNAAVIWILFFSILLAKNLRVDVALIFGFVAGIGLLAKSSVFLFVALSAGALIFVINPKKNLASVRVFVHETYHDRKKVVDFVALFSLSAFVALCLYLTQKFFSPFFHYIAQKNLTFILSPQEWLADPLGLISTNIRLLPLYVAWESGWLPILFGLIGLWQLYKKDVRLALYITLWIMVPFVLIINFNKVLFPRYLIFFPSFFIILTAYLFSQFTRKNIYQMLIPITVVVLLGLSYPILFNVKAISFPAVDRGQYIEGQTAVWGAEDLMQVVRNSTVDGKYALVLAEGNFGLIADVLQVFHKPQDRIEIRGAWPLNETDILRAQKEMDTKHVFVVFSHRKDFPVYWQENIMTLIQKYDKPNNTIDSVYLFEMKEQRAK